MANDPLGPQIRLIRQRVPTPPHHLAGPRPNAFDRAFSHSQDPKRTLQLLLNSPVDTKGKLIVEATQALVRERFLAVLMIDFAACVWPAALP